MLFFFCLTSRRDKNAVARFASPTLRKKKCREKNSARRAAERRPQGGGRERARRIEKDKDRRRKKKNWQQGTRTGHYFNFRPSVVAKGQREAVAKGWKSLLLHNLHGVVPCRTLTRHRVPVSRFGAVFSKVFCIFTFGLHQPLDLPPSLLRALHGNYPKELL